MHKSILLFFSIGLSLYANHISDEVHGHKPSEVEDYESRKYMQSWLDGDFGLKPHYANYLLPYGYRFSGNYKSFNPSDTYEKSEAELQVSLKMNIGNNLFGLNESYNLSYSHTAFWQIYTQSSPFREINYNPEFFVDFPIEDNSIFKFRSFRFAIAHISNGQGNIEKANIPDNLKTIDELEPYLENRSRSVNYIYGTISMQYKSFILDTKLWIPYFGEDLSDNPDLIEYYGLLKFKGSYFYGKNLTTVTVGGNLLKGRGSLSATYSYPIYDSLYFYTKFFTGYGESMIDYNNYVTKLSVGFSFSR